MSDFWLAGQVNVFKLSGKIRKRCYKFVLVCLQNVIVCEFANIAADLARCNRIKQHNIGNRNVVPGKPGRHLRRDTGAQGMTDNYYRIGYPPLVVAFDDIVSQTGPCAMIEDTVSVSYTH